MDLISGISKLLLKNSLEVCFLLVLRNNFPLSWLWSSSIYLGESFCSYISVGNHSNHDVRDVGIKASLSLASFIAGTDCDFSQRDLIGVA